MSMCEETRISSELGEESELNGQLFIGAHVFVGGVKPGHLRFLGPVHFVGGTWCGIELEDPEGLHDGMVDGVRYFQCSNKHGLFAPVHKVSLIADIEAASVPKPGESNSTLASSTTYSGLSKVVKRESVDSLRSRPRSAEVDDSSSSHIQLKLPRPRSAVIASARVEEDLPRGIICGSSLFGLDEKHSRKSSPKRVTFDDEPEFLDYDIANKCKKSKSENASLYYASKAKATKDDDENSLRSGSETDLNIGRIDHRTALTLTYDLGSNTDIINVTENDNSKKDKFIDVPSKKSDGAGMHEVCKRVPASKHSRKDLSRSELLELFENIDREISNVTTPDGTDMPFFLPDSLSSSEEDSQRMFACCQEEFKNMSRTRNEIELKDSEFHDSANVAHHSQKDLPSQQKSTDRVFEKSGFFGLHEDSVTNTDDDEIKVLKKNPSFALARTALAQYADLVRAAQNDRTCRKVKKEYEKLKPANDMMDAGSKWKSSHNRNAFEDSKLSDSVDSLNTDQTEMSTSRDVSDDDYETFDGEELHTIRNNTIDSDDQSVDSIDDDPLSTLDDELLIESSVITTADSNSSAIVDQNITRNLGQVVNKTDFDGNEIEASDQTTSSFSEKWLNEVNNCHSIRSDSDATNPHGDLIEFAGNEKEATEERTIQVFPVQKRTKKTRLTSSDTRPVSMMSTSSSDSRPVSMMSTSSSLDSRPVSMMSTASSDDVGISEDLHLTDSCYSQRPISLISSSSSVDTGCQMEVDSDMMMSSMILSSNIDELDEMWPPSSIDNSMSGQMSPDKKDESVSSKTYATTEKLTDEKLPGDFVIETLDDRINEPKNEVSELVKECFDSSASELKRYGDQNLIECMDGPDKSEKNCECVRNDLHSITEDSSTPVEQILDAKLQKMIRNLVAGQIDDSEISISKLSEAIDQRSAGEDVCLVPISEKGEIVQTDEKRITDGIQHSPETVKNEIDHSAASDRQVSFGTTSVSDASVEFVTTSDHRKVDEIVQIDTTPRVDSTESVPFCLQIEENGSQISNFERDDKTDSKINLVEELFKSVDTCRHDVGSSNHCKGNPDEIKLEMEAVLENGDSSPKLNKICEPENSLSLIFSQGVVDNLENLESFNSANSCIDVVEIAEIPPPVETTNLLEDLFILTGDSLTSQNTYCEVEGEECSKESQKKIENSENQVAISVENSNLIMQNENPEKPMAVKPDNSENSRVLQPNFSEESTTVIVPKIPENLMDMQVANFKENSEVLQPELSDKNLIDSDGLICGELKNPGKSIITEHLGLVTKQENSGDMVVIPQENLDVEMENSDEKMATLRTNTEIVVSAEDGMVTPSLTANEEISQNISQNGITMVEENTKQMALEVEITSKSSGFKKSNGDTRDGQKSSKQTFSGKLSSSVNGNENTTKYPGSTNVISKKENSGVVNATSKIGNPGKTIQTLKNENPGKKNSSSKEENPVNKNLDKEEHLGNPTSKEKNSGNSTLKEKNPGNSTFNERNPGNPTSKERNPGNSTLKEKNTGNPTSKERNPGNPTSKERNLGNPTSKERNPGNPTSKERNLGNPTSKKRNPGNPTSKERNLGNPTSKQGHPRNLTSKGENPGNPSSKEEHVGNPPSKNENQGNSTLKEEHLGNLTSKGKLPQNSTSKMRKPGMSLLAKQKNLEKSPLQQQNNLESSDSGTNSKSSKQHENPIAKSTIPLENPGKIAPSNLQKPKKNISGNLPSDKQQKLEKNTSKLRPGNPVSEDSSSCTELNSSASSFTDQTPLKIPQQRIALAQKQLKSPSGQSRASKLNASSLIENPSIKVSPRIESKKTKVDDSVVATATKPSGNQKTDQSKTKQLPTKKVASGSSTNKQTANKPDVRSDLLNQLDGVKCELEEVKCDLEKMKLETEHLTKERDDVLKSLKTLEEDHKSSLQDLENQHQQNLKASKDQLEKQMKTEIEKVIDQHSHEVNTLRTYHERRSAEQKTQHESVIKDLKKKNRDAIDQMESSHVELIAEMTSKHEAQMHEITERFEEIKQSLLEKVEQLKIRCDDLCGREKNYKDSSKHESELRQQALLEVESLRVVLEQKNEDLKKLRIQNATLDEKAKELPGLKETVTKLQQKVENLEAIISIKNDHEKQLAEMHQALLRKYEKESKAMKRLSMNNDELVWRLSQSDIGPSCLDDYPSSPSKTLSSHVGGSAAGLMSRSYDGSHATSSSSLTSPLVQSNNKPTFTFHPSQTPSMSEHDNAEDKKSRRTEMSDAKGDACN